MSVTPTQVFIHTCEGDVLLNISGGGDVVSTLGHDAAVCLDLVDNICQALEFGKPALGHLLLVCKFVVVLLILLVFIVSILALDNGLLQLQLERGVARESARKLGRSFEDEFVQLGHLCEGQATICADESDLLDLGVNDHGLCNEIVALLALNLAPEVHIRQLLIQAQLVNRIRDVHALSYVESLTTRCRTDVIVGRHLGSFFDGVEGY